MISIFHQTQFQLTALAKENPQRLEEMLESRKSKQAYTQPNSLFLYTYFLLSYRSLVCSMIYIDYWASSLFNISAAFDTFVENVDHFGHYRSLVSTPGIENMEKHARVGNCMLDHYKIYPKIGADAAIALCAHQHRQPPSKVQKAPAPPADEKKSAQYPSEDRYGSSIHLRE